MDTLQELTRRKGIIANNIVTRVQLPDMTERLPVFHESEFEKAIAEGQIEAFTVENVSQFKRNLEKAIADANGDAALLGELEKAGKDLSKLVKVKKQDKRGKMTTVYVRQGQNAKEGGNEKKTEGGEAKTVTHHEGGSTKIVSNGLDVGAVSTHTGEVLKRYKADKPEEVEKYAKHLAIEHNIPVEEKKEEPKESPKKNNRRPEIQRQANALKKRGEADKKRQEEPDYHSLGRILTHDYEHTKKHLGEKYVSKDGKRIDQHAILADHPGDKLKQAADKLDEAKKKQNTESGKKTSLVDYDAVRKWCGDEYDDDQINSVVEAYDEGSEEGGFDNDLKAYVSMIGDAGSQSRESQQVHAAVDDLAGGIQPGNHHEKLTPNGIKEILWGMIMSRMKDKQPQKK